MTENKSSAAQISISHSCTAFAHARGASYCKLHSVKNYRLEEVLHRLEEVQTLQPIVAEPAWTAARHPAACCMSSRHVPLPLPPLARADHEHGAAAHQPSPNTSRATSQLLRDTSEVWKSLLPQTWTAELTSQVMCMVNSTLQ